MNNEPAIAVGLVENAPSVTIELLTEYSNAAGDNLAPGIYRCTAENGSIVISGNTTGNKTHILTGMAQQSRFRLQITIGIDFHWQQEKTYTFSGNLRLLASSDNTLTVINNLPLEEYILSVSCSEMSAASPEEFLKAHSIISRSWLFAQLVSRANTAVPAPGEAAPGEIIRWYDRQSHEHFDVCADDHCQRYQGTDMITTGEVAKAVEATRGMVLRYNGEPCDARFSKCCGGVTEDFRLAWSDTEYPYLVPVADTPDEHLPTPALSDESAARAFITSSPDAYCNCNDATILNRVLNNYDQSTGDFYRWQVRLTPEEIAGYLHKKLSLDIGRPLALEPVERGLSGRLKRLRIVGDKKAVTIGKELEIRRALSSSHLYSSAFVVDTEGP
ncbi:MAG: SpoIID/LytB domain-containing protein, partial [Chitinispirillaceae bacterium]|nr:SpoIID/LytB domain-containing protein [Chitinispirillaceae bacterium]